MKKDYICPKCEGHLRVGNFVVFTIKKDNGQTGLIFLSPILGDYSIVKHTSLNLLKGEKVQVFCPVCHTNILCDDEKKLAKVFVLGEEEEKTAVYFSVIFENQSTYALKDNKVESYGDNANKSLNFENLSTCK